MPLIFLDAESGASPIADEQLLTVDDIPTLLELFHGYNHKWPDIGLGLGFTSPELDQISKTPLLYLSAPTSYMREMLGQFVQWPIESHSTKPTLHLLCSVLRKSTVGLGSHAKKVEDRMKKSSTGKK